MAVAAVFAGGYVAAAVVVAAVVAGFSSYLTSSYFGASLGFGCGFFF